MSDRNALLVDFNLCVGCMACVDACEGLDRRLELGESYKKPVNYTSIREAEGLFVRRLCMHCEYPTCVSVCPVGAFEKTAEGPVIYHYQRCIGCRYCMQACPFSVPKYEWEKLSPRVRKCDMCVARQRQGLQPACAEACPTGATVYGKRDDLLALATQRIDDDPDTYVNHIFGANEVGGTSVLYLSSVPFAKLGFPSNLPTLPLPNLTWDVLSQIPKFSVAAGVLMYGVWWIIDRRMENGKDASQLSTSSDQQKGVHS